MATTWPNGKCPRWLTSDLRCSSSQRYIGTALLQRGRTRTGGNWDDRHEPLFVWVLFVEERSYRKLKWNRIAKHCGLSCRPAKLQPSSSRDARFKEEDKSVSSIVVERPGVKSWLANGETNGVMTCRFYLASNFDNNFTRGCRDLQRSALVRHINPIMCKDHFRAVADAEQRKANAIAVQNFQEAAVDKAL